MRFLRSFLSAIFVFGFTSFAFSQQSGSTHSHSAEGHHHEHGHAAAAGPNGGTIHKVGDYNVETVIREKGIMFTVLSTDAKQLDVSKASGKLSLRVGDNAKEYAYDLKPLKNGAIGVGVNLSKVVSHDLHLNVQLQGITSSAIEFHAMGRVGEDGLSDALLISLQGTCPVSGQSLGSMGKPPKVQLGDKALFVCCAGCVDKLKKSSDEYLTKYYTAKGKEVRPGVFESTLADADAIAAQKVCPVMDEPLGGMGVPGKVNVKGKAVFICCAGCAKKLAAEPDKYLAALKEKGVTPPAFE